MAWITLSAFFSDKRAMNAIGVTLLFGLVSPLLLNVFGLLLALLFDSKIKGKVFARTAVYMPSIISPLIMGYLWTLILSPSTGVLDKSLEQLGVNGSFDWMGDPKKAIWLIIIVNVWQFVGGPMMIYLAGLQSVPMDLYESAKIDGANTWQSFEKMSRGRCSIPRPELIFSQTLSALWRCLTLLWRLRAAAPAMLRNR